MLHFFINKIPLRLWQKENPCLLARCLVWAVIEECVNQEIFRIYWEKQPQKVWHLKARLKYLYYRNTTSKKNHIWKVNISVLKTTFWLFTSTWLSLEHWFLLIPTGVRSNLGNVSSFGAYDWEQEDLASKTFSLTVLSWASDPSQFVRVGKMLKWEVSPSGAVGAWALFGDIEGTISRGSCEIPQSSLEHTRPNPPLISAAVSPWIRLKLLLVCCCTKSGRNHGWLTPLA